MPEQETRTFRRLCFVQQRLVRNGERHLCEALCRYAFKPWVSAPHGDFTEPLDNPLSVGKVLAIKNDTRYGNISGTECLKGE
jgi:hypothetical protein